MMAASKSPRARLLHIRDEIEGVAMIVRGLRLEGVIARSEATKQSIVSFFLALDCFAPLAMRV